MKILIAYLKFYLSFSALFWIVVGAFKVGEVHLGQKLIDVTGSIIAGNFIYFSMALPLVILIIHLLYKLRIIDNLYQLIQQLTGEK